MPEKQSMKKLYVFLNGALVYLHLFGILNLFPFFNNVRKD